MKQNHCILISSVMFLICATLLFVTPAPAELEQIQQTGILKVAVYNEFPPFSVDSRGIDVDLADALCKKLGLKMSLLPFPAGENLKDDLRNMVWKGHYLGYGPADLLMHVPVDRRLANEVDQVEIFAPYHREIVKLVYNSKKMPDYDNLDSLQGKKIGVEQTSISAILILGEQDGKFRDTTKLYDTSIAALEGLKVGEVDAVLATQSEIESVFKGDNNYPVAPVAFPRLPNNGWAIGLAVKKSEPELARALQKAMDELVASGELIKLFGKYGVSVVTP